MPRPTIFGGIHEGLVEADARRRQKAIDKLAAEERQQQMMIRQAAEERAKAAELRAQQEAERKAKVDDLNRQLLEGRVADMPMERERFKVGLDTDKQKYRDTIVEDVLDPLKPYRTGADADEFGDILSPAVQAGQMYPDAPSFPDSLADSMEDTPPQKLTKSNIKQMVAEAAMLAGKHKTNLSDLAHRRDLEKIAAQGVARGDARGEADREAMERLYVSRLMLANSQLGQHKAKFTTKTQALADMAPDLNIFAEAAFDSDIPGYGLMERNLPRAALAQRAEQVRAAATRLTPSLLRAEIGSQQTRAEIQNIIEALGTGKNVTERQVREGAMAIWSALARDIAHTQGNYQEIYEGFKGGFADRPDMAAKLANPFDSDLLKFIPASKKIPEVIIMRSRQGETLFVDRDDIVRMMAQEYATPVANPTTAQLQAYKNYLSNRPGRTTLPNSPLMNDASQIPPPILPNLGVAPIPRR